VEEELGGRGAQLKEYTIATEVYEKPPDFDPRVDPIVRVEARRLRDRLKDYYQGEGSADPIQIEFPKSSYVPVFRDIVAPLLPQSELPSQRWILWSVLALLAAMILIGTFLTKRHPPARHGPPGRVMLVILPFQNLTGDADQEYLCDGMTEEMSVLLGSLDPRQLAVIARTSAMKYKHTQKGIDEIGKELGVDYVLEGSVRRSGKRLRFTAQLIEVRDQTHLWAKDYDREAKDVLGVQSEIADAIAREVQLKVSPEAKTQQARAHNVPADAYEAYLRGRYFFNKGTREGFRKGIEYFEQAIRRDPNDALAHDGLADAYAFLARYHGISPEEAFTKARDEANKAVAINPDLAEAHSTLGEVLAEFWDWKDSVVELRRALQLNPNYSLTHLRYGGYLAFTGYLDEAIAEFKEAQRLDPLSPNVNAELANAYTAIPDYDDAIRQSLKTLELEKDYIPAIRVLGEAYEKRGIPQAAFEAYRRLPALSGYGQDRLDALDRAFEAKGMKGYWTEMLKFVLEDRPQKPFAQTFFLAWLYAHLGNKEESFRWLETAYQEHDFNLVTITLEIDFDFMRSDPRFQDLMHRIGLED